jgi:hypothetical protein
MVEQLDGRLRREVNGQPGRGFVEVGEAGERLGGLKEKGLALALVPDATVRPR